MIFISQIVVRINAQISKWQTSDVHLLVGILLLQNDRRRHSVPVPLSIDPQVPLIVVIAATSTEVGTHGQGNYQHADHR